MFILLGIFVFDNMGRYLDLMSKPPLAAIMLLKKAEVIDIARLDPPLNDEQFSVIFKSVEVPGDVYFYISCLYENSVTSTSFKMIYDNNNLYVIQDMMDDAEFTSPSHKADVSEKERQIVKEAVEKYLSSHFLMSDGAKSN